MPFDQKPQKVVKSTSKSPHKFEFSLENCDVYNTRWLMTQKMKNVEIYICFF